MLALLVMVMAYESFPLLRYIWEILLCHLLLRRPY